MKRFFFIVMSVLFIMASIPCCAIATDEVTVVLDGNLITFDVPPQIIDGRTMVPMRKIFEKLGTTVEWFDTTKTITATKENTSVKMTIGDNTIHINGNDVLLDVPPILTSGYTYVPLRAVSEAFNAKVNWSSKNKLVTISLNKPVSYADFYNVPDIGAVFNLQLTDVFYPTEYICAYDYNYDESFEKLFSEENVNILEDVMMAYDYILLAQDTATDYGMASLRYMNAQDMSYTIRLFPRIIDDTENVFMRVEVEKNVPIYKENTQEGTLFGTQNHIGWLRTYVPASEVSRNKDYGWVEQNPYVNQTIWVHRNAIYAFTGQNDYVGLPAYIPITITDISEETAVPENIFIKEIKKLQVECNDSTYSCDVNLFDSNVNIYAALGYGLEESTTRPINDIMYNTPIKLNEDPQIYFQLTDAELLEVQQGVVYNGISEKVFLIIKGAPSHVIETATDNSVIKQYTYEDRHSTNYFNFINGTMVSDSSIRY